MEHIQEPVKTIQRTGVLANGEPEHSSPAAQDAELARENAQLRRERDLLQAVIDGLPDPIYVKDRHSRFVASNFACARLLGAASPQHLINKTDFDCFPRDFADRYFADEQKVIQLGQTLNVVERTPDHASGQMRWMQTTKMPHRDASGGIIGLIGIGRDITELKNAEEASSEELRKRTSELSQDRLLLRTLIDNLPDCIYAKDAAGRKILANPADLKNLNCPSEADAMGKTDFDFFPREMAEKFWADDQKVIGGERVIDREEFLFDKEGRKVWLLTSKLPLRDPGGRLMGLIGIGRDITKQKETEAKLAYEQRLFRQLLEALPENIYFKDLESRFVRVSHSKAQSTLQTVREAYQAAHPEVPPDAWPAHLTSVKLFGDWLIGKTDFDTYPEAYARMAYEDEQEIIRTGKTMAGKLQRAEQAGGTVIWRLSTKMPWRDAEGNIIGTFGTSLDVTQLKHVEEELNRERTLLRTLIDGLPDAVYVKDAAGRFILNNVVHAKRRGMNSPEEMKGKTDFDFFPKETAEQFAADERKIIETGQAIINQEQCVAGSDGSSENRWTAVSKVIWKDDAGDILGTIGITHDIHEFKVAQEALRASEAKLRESATRLERSNRELQDFAYVASHDLQEPLRKIVVFGDRLKEKASSRLDPENLDYLERMQKAASRMQNLINDLLTFSRVTTKAQPFVPVNLSEILSEVIEDLEGRIEMTSGRVERGPLPVIDGEPLQIRQLLQNLIGNALKFRRLDIPPVVKIEARTYTGILPRAEANAEPQELCELTVSDNGIGFDEKYLDRIFNVFQRLHTRNEYEGTGMGLAIARKIVLYHGGDITAKSVPGQGATFMVTLPVKQPKNPTNENKL